MRTIVIIAAFVVLTGCASPTTQRMKIDSAASAIEAKKQREIALQTTVEYDKRLFNIYYPMFTKSVSLCGDKTRHSLGIQLANNLSYGDEFRDAAESALGLSSSLKILHVAPDSAGSKAGIISGDAPVALNEWPIPSDKDAVKATFEQLQNLLKDGKPIQLALMRGKERITVHAAPDLICDYPAVIDPQDIVNAFADGKRIVVTKGMMRFARDDIELSLVVAHELAHNTMKHMDSKRTNVVIGSIFDIVAAAYGVNTRGTFGNMGASAYSQDFEAEADYVGLYIMAKAGLPIDSAPGFWRRMAAEHPGSIKSNHAASHPPTPERFLALEATAREIQTKQASGNPLVPETKKQ